MFSSAIVRVQVFHNVSLQWQRDSCLIWILHMYMGTLYLIVHALQLTGSACVNALILILLVTYFV